MCGEEAPRAWHCRAWCDASSDCSVLSLLDHRDSKPGRWKGLWQVTVLGTWGHLSWDPTLQWKTSPLLFSGSCCCAATAPYPEEHGAAQGWTRTWGTLLPWAVVSLKHRECCRAEIVRVQRTDSLLQPKGSSSGQGKAYLLSKATLPLTSWEKLTFVDKLIFKTY